MDRDMVARAKAAIAEDFASSLNRLYEFAKQVEQLEELTGLSFIKSQWGLRYGNSFDVERSQLPIIRKALGRLEMTGKDLAGDFDSSNEVCVTVKPKAKEFNRLRFVYRTKFRAGGKCKVVESTYTPYKSLVCSV
jgi:hypothetical protein